MSADRHTDGRLSRKVTFIPFMLAAVSLALLFSGCSSKERYHSALMATDDDITHGAARGKRLIASGANPSDAYSYRVEEVNLRISADVILRSAGLGLPADEIAYQVALGGDDSDAGVRRAVAGALKTLERELKTIAVVQVAKSRDPASIDFALKTNTGTKYPPIAVETPTFLRDVTAAYDRTAPPAVLYSYVIHFPARGGPGVPAIGPTVSSLNLLVIDGEYEGKVTFSIRNRSQN